MSRTRQTRRRGAAAVEFAVALPLLIALCLVSVDFGRFAYAYIALGNATRVGAEAGATRGYTSTSEDEWEDRIVTAVEDDFTAVGGINPAQLTVEIETADDAYDLFLVSVKGRYNFFTLVTWPGLPRPIVLQRFCAMRRFR